MGKGERREEISIKNRSMIESIRKDGRCDESVLKVLEKLDRQDFLPTEKQGQPIGMTPISIGFGQTMSAPFIVGSMSSLLEIEPGMRVLEIGTGCGYQTAVLLGLGAVVYSIEIIPELLRMAKSNLERLEFSNFYIHSADGYFGWSQHAPYDRIIAAATSPMIPEPWIRQLSEGGIVVMPLERNGAQWMAKAVKRNGKFDIQWLYGVRFVPFVGKVRERTSHK